MNPMQLEHSSSKFTKNKFPVVLICDGVQSPANIGSLFRISDALGIEKIEFCNATINISSTRLLRTARNTHKNVSYHVSNNCIELIDFLKKDGYKILALEITKNSIPIEDFNVIKGDKIALVIGNEQYGISEEVLDKIPNSTHINMYGKNSSMNVVQATAIALYNLINKMK